MRRAGVRISGAAAISASPACGEHAGQPQRDQHAVAPGRSPIATRRQPPRRHQRDKHRSNPAHPPPSGARRVGAARPKRAQPRHRDERRRPARRQHQDRQKQKAADVEAKLRRRRRGRERRLASARPTLAENRMGENPGRAAIVPNSPYAWRPTANSGEEPHGFRHRHRHVERCVEDRAARRKSSALPMPGSTTRR